jgi:surface carbohydrate biosynthesis protein
MSRPPLIIPVENQVRELDPKLLLAALAAQRGFTSILGSHRDIDFRIASFPRGLYLNKSMTDRNLKMFQIMRRLGHLILTWDEEALVHLPPAIYYSRRLSPTAIRYVSHLFAWGEDNADLWRRYPDFPADLPVHVTGNPRNDLLRPELHPFYADQVQAVRERYGDFLLVNTNFNHVNAFFPAQNLFKPARHAGEPLVFGKAGVGMTREFAEALRDQKQAVFEAFLRLIPELARAFPGLAIIVRPHPTEGQDVYRELSSDGGGRIHVTNEGNVVPWLMAAKALIHNGCTTGVEAFVMRTPAFSYRPSVCPAIDDSFYLLPHGLSHQCFTAEELLGRIGEVVAGRLGAADGDARTALVRRYLTGQDGAFACERLLDVLESILRERDELPAPPVPTRALGRLLADGRFLLKRVKSYFPGSHAPPEFHRHRYPDVSGEEMLRRIRRFQSILKNDTRIRIESIAPRIFRISPEQPA